MKHQLRPIPLLSTEISIDEHAEELLADEIRKPTHLHCTRWPCDNVALVWMEKGAAMQTGNGFLIAKIGGWYCPKCAGAYGGKP